LTVDVKKRPSAAQALKHPWLSHIKEVVDQEATEDILNNLKAFRADEILK